ncbi:MAG: hypothetical protein ACJ8NS_00765 [Chthoniobacterales bacterium]
MERDLHLISEIGQAAREAFGKVFEEWNSEADWPIKRAVEAQIAAASLGYKPLYWDPWGEEASARLRFQLRRGLPAGTIIGTNNAGLAVFQESTVRPILDSDPAFYRPSGESDLPAVLLVSRAGFNGELLGYGARSFDTPGVVPVRIVDDDGELFASFMSAPGVAERHARERLLDIATYTGADLIYTIG